MATRSLRTEFFLDREMFRDRDAALGRTVASASSPTSYALVEANAVFLAECYQHIERIKKQMPKLYRALQLLKQKSRPASFCFEENDSGNTTRSSVRLFTQTAQMITELSAEVRRFQPTDRVGWSFQKALATQWEMYHREFNELYERYRVAVDSMALKQERIQSATNAASQEKQRELEEESHRASLMARGFSTEEISELLLQRTMALEKSRECHEIMYELEELNHMYRDVAALISEQGTVLDQISYNIQHAITSVQLGTKEIKKAADSHQRCIVM